jgi:hypothetical protein
MKGPHVTASRWLENLQARFFLIWLIGWCSLSVGCVPSKVQVRAAPQFDPSGISRLAVLPFQAIQTPQWGSGPTHPGVLVEPEGLRPQFQLPGANRMDVNGSGRDLYTVSDRAANRITAKVVSALAGRPSLEVVGPLEPSVLWDKESRTSSRSLAELAKEVGTRLKVDGVLTGLVRTYREREGSSFGAKPAAMGFEIYLLRSTDGSVLWTGTFFEEQKPFIQDVPGFFEKGGGFVTADTLADLGVQKVMKAFPVGQGDHGPRLPATSLLETP